MGMTGEELAERCDISTTYLRQLEGGKKKPSIEMLGIICHELGVSPNYLLPEMVPDRTTVNMEELAVAVNGMTTAQIRAVVSAIKALRRELDW